MKTAMQELIEHLNHVKEFNQMIPGIIKGAEALLEKEKEQIRLAFYRDGYDYWDKITSEEYYNQTYNENK
jgi:hypothetical protein